MNGRILRVELRRSIALWSGALLVVLTLGFLYLLPGPWARGDLRWTAQWTPSAWWIRGQINFVWPLAVGAGALQGLRDARSRTGELFASTPRPPWHRAAAVAGALAVAMALTYLLLTLAGGGSVMMHGGPFHLGWTPIAAVGVLALVAAAWFGQGVARTIPSVLTPPVLAVLTLIFLWVMLASDTGAVLEGRLPYQVTLLSPALHTLHSEFLTTAGGLDLGQAIWLLGLGATGLCLLVAGSGRTRLLAAVPVALGALLALPILPAGPAQAYVPDPAVTVPVCAGPVCVTRLHQDRLAMLAGPARQALGLLARLPDAPTSVREQTGTPSSRTRPAADPAVIPVDFDAADFDGASGVALRDALLAGAGAPPCHDPYLSPVEPETLFRELAGRAVAAAWFTGELRPYRAVPWSQGEIDRLARPAYAALRALPAAEQRTRMAALRAAALSCEGDLLRVLAGGGTE
ncbi:hypothetical protein Sru01_67100 [Sphaerisporangium rufum]|uniref:Uncharacterized protein n=1 Tax=Sphaerisporangium rufum TaxID=1381558 RepID=A0A919R9L1_9ACTN|nr:hypothetical protein [Sphaerisporangium rufum]GII81728.1 hypothetical protein Sru01_67100 [Sphaerisporangium rufum]